MQVKDIINAIETVVPKQYQESYDNTGLQIGDLKEEVNGVLIALDVTEGIIEEALNRQCNMIISHHPLLFSGIKNICNRNYVERVVKMAIKNDINIYSCHTSLDNMLDGVNAKIAEKLGLQKTRILAPKQNTICKLYTYVPHENADQMLDALFAAGAGHIGKYNECSFSTKGMGSFRAGADTNPTIGKAGGARETVDEIKIEVILERRLENIVLETLFKNHPYEEVAYELIPVPNRNQNVGAGLIGYLKEPIGELAFLHNLKTQMKTDCIRHTQLRNKNIEKVAICGGSGSFLLPDAMNAEADIFISGDFKYHQFFDAEGKIIIADIGHYESEQYTVEIFEQILKKNFPNFAVLLSYLNTNPIQYFC